MSGTAVLFLLAFGLFGILDGCGAIRAVTGYLLAAARTPRRAAVITVLFGFGLNVICASAMCSFIFTLSCLMPLYEEEGWERSVLVRSSFVGCPVSYTHLDVYKRQPVYRPAHRETQINIPDFLKNKR